MGQQAVGELVQPDDAGRLGLQHGLDGGAPKKPARWLASCTLSVKASSFLSRLKGDWYRWLITTDERLAAWEPTRVKAKSVSQAGHRCVSLPTWPPEK